MEFPPITDSEITVSCPNGLVGPPPFTGGDLIAVTVDYDFDLITPIVGQWFGGQINLSKTFTGEVFLGSCLTP